MKTFKSTGNCLKSQVCILLLLCMWQTKSAELACEERNYGMSGKKILIVDDEKDILSVLKKRLAIAGYDVITADNGQLALLMAKSQQPDLIILDIQMPDMDGGKVDSKLKEDPTTRDIPVVFSTCMLSGSESSQKRHDCGGNVMIAKSSDSQELIAVIEQNLLV